MTERKGSTGAMLWLLSNRWRAAVTRALEPLGLTHAEYVLLAPLYGLVLAGEGPSQRELGSAANLEPIYVSKLVKALERDGLVVRGASARDARAFSLTLSERGVEVITGAIAIVQELQHELLAPIGGVTSARHREFRELLGDLLAGQLSAPRQRSQTGEDS